MWIKAVFYKQNTQFCYRFRTLMWIYGRIHRRSRIFLRCIEIFNKRQTETGSSNDRFSYGTVRDVPIDLSWAATSSIGSTS